MGEGWDCIPQVPIKNLAGRTFQEWIVRQPVRYGGFGVRGQADVAPIAFIGALEQSLTSFGGETGVCVPLSHMVPVPGEVSDDRRWESLVDSGCRTGRELESAWGTIKGEAEEGAQFLEQEVDKMFNIL